MAGSVKKVDDRSRDNATNSSYHRVDDEYIPNIYSLSDFYSQEISSEIRIRTSNSGVKNSSQEMCTVLHTIKVRYLTPPLVSSIRR